MDTKHEALRQFELIQDKVGFKITDEAKELFVMAFDMGFICGAQNATLNALQVTATKTIKRI